MRTIAQPLETPRKSKWSASAAWVLVLAATAARGQPSLMPNPTVVDSPAAMDSAMRTYFAGELTESRVFLVVGAGSIAAGVGLLVSGTDARRGASVPLLGIGLLEAVLGLGLQFRTPGQVAALSDTLSRSPQAYAEAERARMRRVNRGFPIYRAVEASLAFAGFALAGTGGVTQSDFALGAGLGLALEATVMLLFDLFAERRGLQYESALLGFRF
jgi:hypothetical protein